MNAEIKRGTRVVQVFPSDESLVRLVGAVCCDQDDAWLGASNFIDRKSLEPGRGPPGAPAPTPADLEGGLSGVQEAFDRRLRAA